MTRLIAAITSLVAIAAPAAAIADGGSIPETPRPGPVNGWVTLRDGSVSMKTQVGLLTGGTFTPSGSAGAPGARVVVERLDAPNTWKAVAYSKADRSGIWRASWKPGGPGRVSIRVRSAATQGTPSATVSVYRRSHATWFGGPGHSGEPTACGPRLKLRTLGVANRTLPCGTMVEISVGTRSITVPVIDRGPYRPGYDWDLTWEAARQLQMDGLATIGYLLQ